MNNLPESIKKKIEDEAVAKTAFEQLKMAGFPEGYSDYHCKGYKQGYTAAATNILSHPQEWRLSGVWVKGSERLPDEEWYGPIRYRYDERYKIWEYDSCGSREIQNNIENYPDVEWLDDSAAPSDRVQQLEQALKIIAEWRLPETGKFWDEEKTRPMSYESEYGSNGAREYMKAIATNALKQ